MSLPVKRLKKKYILIIFIVALLWVVYLLGAREVISSYLVTMVSTQERIPSFILNFHSLLLFYTIVTVSLLLILSMWDYLENFVKVEYVVLFISVGILNLAEEDVYMYQSKRLWLFCIFFIGLYFLLRSRFFQKSIGTTISKFISSRLCIFTLSITVLLGWFLYSFPLKEWTWYISVDDYPAVFALSKHGADIIKQGGYFGWDSSFVGGYFTASEMGMNLVHFLLPLSLFGWEIGFHLLILISFLSFPLLCLEYVKTCCKVNDNRALLTLPIASFFVLHYFDYRIGLLGFGMIAAFIGIDLLILSLILLERLKEKKRYAFFLLTLTLSLLFYTHLGFFMYAVMFILIDFLITPRRENLGYICCLGCLLLMVVSPFLIYKLKYSDYLILDNRNYSPPGFSFDNYFINVIRSLYRLIDYNSWTKVEAYYPLLFSPILVYLFFQKNWKRETIFSLFIVIFYALVPSSLSSLYLLFSRIRFLTPFFLSILTVGFLITNYEKKNFLILLFGLLISMMCLNNYFVNKPYVFKHAQPGDFYNKPLVGMIKNLDGRYIAVENNQHWKRWGNKVVPYFHWLSLLQLETNKLYFSNMYDGYHHTPYRGNSFEGGFFKGKRIDKWAIEDINKILLQWGVKYVVVWNEKTKEYFSGYPEFFKDVWQDTDWVIFQFQNADIRSAIVDSGGKATVIDKDYFEKHVILSGVKKGAKVTVRSNYFPAWKAYYNNKELALINSEGQVGFIAPDSGNYGIIFKYPRYTLLNILAIIALSCSCLLSCKRVVP